MTKKKFNGVFISEVWDYRLSSAVPQIDTRSGTWVAHVYDKINPNFYPADPEEIRLASISKPLESFDTGIKTELGDEHDTKKVIACYEWFYSVRDKYALDNIKEIKAATRIS